MVRGITLALNAVRFTFKTNKYFKDEKWSLPEKEDALVLVSNDDKIIWIVNSRMDDRFKLTNNTKNILKIQLTQ